mgnify:CR=1 FL=1
MSDYDSFESGAESELGAFEEALEVSGYDAVTTTQDGMRQDEFLKESGMAIDTVGDAKKVEEKREKREKNSESGIAAAFEAARHHVDNHKYEIKFDGKDYEISHGDLKKAVSKEHERLQQKSKTEKDPKKKAQLQQDMQFMHRIMQQMQEGPLSAQQQQELSEYIERNPHMISSFELQQANTDIRQTAAESLHNSQSLLLPREDRLDICEDFSLVAPPEGTEEYLGTAIMTQSNHNQACNSNLEDKNPETILTANNVRASATIVNDFT